MRNRVHQEADSILEGSLEGLIQNNQQLADKLKDILRQEAKPAEEESMHLASIISVLKHVQPTFENRLKSVQEYDFIATTTEEAA